MYRDYQEHVLQTQAAIAAQRLPIRGEYISGLIDGDGCVSFHIGPSPRSFSFSCYFSLSVDKGASLLLEVFCSYFQDDFERKSKLKSFQPTGKAAIVYSTQNKGVLQKLASHAEKYPMLGKGPQIQVLHVFLGMSQADFRDKTQVRNLIKLIYQNSPDRRTRKRALDEFLLEVDKKFDH